ncbi:N-acetyltransferase [Duganella sp. FT50W]|uniref:N-acetyltransferase n=1 Tax=Duganella lactea TaxID=2692173 RepID=A0A6L8MIZ5_9BURK|nr:GNAT family N-acetyltransferase [Duganella lactea]MYM82509.1 N-acetyltransferase [Duganella lactea]
MSFVIARFDPSAKYAGYNQFDCQHQQINKFVKDSLKKQVKQGLSVAYALLEESQDANSDDRFVGFFTIASHSIPLDSLSALQLGSLPKVIPCVRLIMLGINHSDSNNGFGKMLMNHALDITKAGAAHIGCYGMYLDADAGAIAKGFYQKLGFHLLDGDKSPAPSPMFIPIASF